MSGPFQAAYESGEQTGAAADYGRWTTLPYTLLGDDGRPSPTRSL